MRITPLGPQVNFAADGTGGGASGTPPTAPTSPSSGSSASSSPTSSPSSAPSTTAPSTAPSTTSPGAAPTAAPTPTSPGQGPSPPVPGEVGVQTEFDFDAIFGDNDFFGEPAPKEAAPPVAAPPMPPAAPVVSTASQPAQPGPQEPTTTAEAQPPAQQKPEAAASKFDPGDPMSIASAMQENRDAYIQRLAQTQFALSPEDMAALEADVTTAVPRLLARVYVDAAIGQMSQIARSVPLMVQRHLEVSAARTQSESEFYSKWPQLDRKQHHELVNKYAIDLRRMHPDMSTEEMMNRVGPLVMMQAGIPFATSGSHSAPGTSQPPAGVPRPQVTVQGQNGRAVQVPQPAPFVPAPPGVAGAVPIPDANEGYAWMGGQDD